LFQHKVGYIGARDYHLYSGVIGWESVTVGAGARAVGETARSHDNPIESGALHALFLALMVGENSADQQWYECIFEEDRGPFQRFAGVAIP
jgi:hypothetical protein